MDEKILEVRLSLYGKNKELFDEILQEERNKAIEEFKQDMINKINFEEKWLFDCKSNNADTNIAFSSLRIFCESRAEQLKGVEE